MVATGPPPHVKPKLSVFLVRVVKTFNFNGLTLCEGRSEKIVDDDDLDDCFMSVPLMDYFCTFLNHYCNSNGAAPCPAFEITSKSHPVFIPPSVFENFKLSKTCPSVELKEYLLKSNVFYFPLHFEDRWIVIRKATGVPEIFDFSDNLWDSQKLREIEEFIIALLALTRTWTKGLCLIARFCLIVWPKHVMGCFQLLIRA